MHIAREWRVRGRSAAFADGCIGASAGDKMLPWQEFRRTAERRRVGIYACLQYSPSLSSTMWPALEFLLEA